MVVNDIYEKCLPKPFDYPDSADEYLDYIQRCAQVLGDFKQFKYGPELSISQLTPTKKSLQRRILKWVTSIESMGVIIGGVGALVVGAFFLLKGDSQTAIFMGAVVGVALLSLIPSILRIFVEK